MGSTLTIAGVTFTDPTFAVPALGFVPSFTYSIDWGDGTPATTGTVQVTVPGSPAAPLTTGTLGGTHVYGDAQTYTVTVTVFDHTGASGQITFQQVVNNVPPTMTTVVTVASVLEGSTVQTSAIGFSSPSFPVPTLGYTPTFTYTIDWGDSTPVQTGVAPVTLLGSVGVATQGTFTLSHLYGVVGTYTATITITDSHGGQASQQFHETVIDVPPTLTGVGFTELNLLSITTSGGQAFDPGTNPLSITVNWGDGTTTVYTVPGAKLNDLTLTHLYLGPPDPNNPAAPIPVMVTISEIVGSSVTQHFTVQVPGIESFIVTFIPEPTAPPLPAPLTVLTEQSSFNVSTPVTVLPTVQPVPARGEELGAVEDQIVLRVVFPSGKEGENVLLPGDVLENLPGYLKRLPDGHYRVYFVQGDTRRERLIIEVNVRQGRPVDAGDDSEGTQDRPPSARIEIRRPWWRNGERRATRPVSRRRRRPRTLLAMRAKQRCRCRFRRPISRRATRQAATWRKARPACQCGAWRRSRRTRRPLPRRIAARRE